MGLPEKDRKDEAKSHTPQDPDTPELDAVVPEPKNPHDVFHEIDSYQKKIESEWDQAKKDYEKKIDKIMDDFITNQQTELEKEQPKPEPPAPPSKPKIRKKYSKDVNDFMVDVQKKLEAMESKSKEITLRNYDKPSVINVPWQPINPRRRNIWVLVMGALLIVGGAFLFQKFFFQIQPVTPLPYSHTSGLHMDANKFYVVDWFRKVLYIHSIKKGAPLLAVETLPNSFSTGFAYTPKYLYSANGFSPKIIEHALTSDHRVLKSYEVPAKKPSGLFWDGEHLWTFDNQEKKFYQLRGNEIDDVIKEYTGPDINLTAFQIVNNRIWILDGGARVIHIYRLENPLRGLASFDLDPFLKGGIPTGIHVEEKKVWVVTENPSLLIQISHRQLKKSHPDTF